MPELAVNGTTIWYERDGVGPPCLDLVTSAPQADRIADRIPLAERVVFEESGHMPWLDEPDRFFEAVTSWLDSQTKSSVAPNTSRPAP